MAATDKQTTFSESKPRRFRIKEYTVGVWKLKIALPSSSLSIFDTTAYKNAVHTTIPVLYRLATDVYRISPRTMIFYLACLLLGSVESSVQMYLSNKLLRLLESSIVAQNMGDSRAIIYALIAHLLATLAASLRSWYEIKVTDIVENKCKQYFKLIAMKGDLAMDLAASKEYETNQSHGREQGAWSAIDGILTFMTYLLRGVSQLILIINLANSVGGPLFVLICVMYPVASHLFSKSYSSYESLAYTVNDDYHRLQGLQKLAEPSYRQEVISNGLAGWIVKEVGKHHRQLQDFTATNPYMMVYNAGNEAPYGSMSLSLLKELPIIFCAVNALFYPEKFSVASLAILHQSAMSLHASTQMALYFAGRFSVGVETIKKHYTPPTPVNLMKDGHFEYPREGKSTSAELAGMGFELKDVSFSYPGTQNVAPSINNMNLSIKPGQLVVIVGANGSGKSTLIRLLSRLYDPSAGQVLIDGLPSHEYRVADLHRATSLLSQDGMLFPLSLRENIGLGYPGNEEDDEMVTEAVRQGGADEIVKKLKDGINTMLDPNVKCVSRNLHGVNKDHPLVVEMEALRKVVEVSGGEKQRIVAARTFMRFNSGTVRFVAVDEPSSALDAEGELKLFQSLIAAREGKTMVFVTHRFGHLTRLADKIICLKDGLVVEEGLHEELMLKDAEYAKLYNIQAAAFK